VHLPVAHAVQKLGVPAAFGLGHQVVRVFLGLGNHALAQRAHQSGLLLRRLESFGQKLAPYASGHAVIEMVQ
jgi:hypothetical protein